MNLEQIDVTKLSFDELDALVSQAGNLMYAAREEKKSRARSQEFLKTKDFKALVKEYQTLEKRHEKLKETRKVTASISITLNVTPRLSDLDDVVNGEDLSGESSYCGHQVEGQIAKGRLKEEQHEALQAGLDEITNERSFCQTALKLIPGLQKEMESLETDLAAFRTKLEGKGEVDEDWLFEEVKAQASKEAK